MMGRRSTPWVEPCISQRNRIMAVGFTCMIRSIKRFLQMFRIGKKVSTSRRALSCAACAGAKECTTRKDQSLSSTSAPFKTWECPKDTCQRNRQCEKQRVHLQINRKKQHILNLANKVLGRIVEREATKQFNSIYQGERGGGI